MNNHWNDFIEARNNSDTIIDNNLLSIVALKNLGVLEVSGSDAAVFLQGQTTCDINQLEEHNPQLGAYCNAKGRTISSFIIIKKTNNIFYLILSADLIAPVQKKLQMYILRAAVTLIDQSESLCILGLYNYSLDTQDNIYAYLNENKRCLFIADINNCQQFFTNLIQENTVQLISSNAWYALDILTGIPWLNSNTTELFVPQMMNLDKLGAISFEKGCYTGQEVVARTHYLGKNKRVMLTATCNASATFPETCSITEQADANVILGTVISSSQQTKNTLLLIILKEHPKDTNNLQLNNKNKDAINIIYSE